MANEHPRVHRGTEPAPFLRRALIPVEISRHHPLTIPHEDGHQLQIQPAETLNQRLGLGLHRNQTIQAACTDSRVLELHGGLGQISRIRPGSKAFDRSLGRPASLRALQVVVVYVVAGDAHSALELLVGKRVDALECLGERAVGRLKFNQRTQGPRLVGEETAAVGTRFRPKDGQPPTCAGLGFRMSTRPRIPQ